MSLKSRIDTIKKEGQGGSDDVFKERIEFQPGAHIIVRGAEWIVKEIRITESKRTIIKCIGVSEIVKHKNLMFFTDIDEMEILNPGEVEFVIDKSPNFTDTKLYLESYFRQQIPTDKDIHIGNRALIDEHAYQLIPTSIALKNPLQRLFIADEDGLGKTIEAGILLSELMIRGRAQRILVVTTHSNIKQLQKDYWNRFTIPFVCMDQEYTSNLKNKISEESNPYYYYDKIIISYDTMNNDTNFKKFIDHTWWDVIILDEAHNISYLKSQQNQSVKMEVSNEETENDVHYLIESIYSDLPEKMAHRCESLILLTEMPVVGGPELFSTFLNMLYPAIIPNDQDPYGYLIMDDIIIQRTKISFNYELTKEQINIFKREYKHESYIANSEEEVAFNCLNALELEIDAQSKKPNTTRKFLLFKTILKKALFSSPVACIKTIENKLIEIDKTREPKFDNDIVKLNKLKVTLKKIDKSKFSKYQQLLKLLNNKKYGWSIKSAEDRIVIFTDNVFTKKYLVDNLKTDLKIDDKVIKDIDSSMRDVELNNVIDEFNRLNSPVRILVISDIASRPLCLHYYCHRIINFDRAWSHTASTMRQNAVERHGQTKLVDIRDFIVNTELATADSNMEEMNSFSSHLLLTEDVRDLTTIESQEFATGLNIENKFIRATFDESYEVPNDIVDILSKVMYGKNCNYKNASINNKVNINLLSDLEYVKLGLSKINQLINSSQNIDNVYTNDQSNNLVINDKNDGVIEIEMPDKFRKLIDKYLPSEFQPPLEENLVLIKDRDSMRAVIDENDKKQVLSAALLKKQYLWPMHPVMLWLNDKMNCLFSDNKAALVLIRKGLKKGEFIFIIEGHVTNKRANLVINEVFGLLYNETTFIKHLKINEIFDMMGLDKQDVINEFTPTLKYTIPTDSCVNSVIKVSRDYMFEQILEYKKKTEDIIKTNVRNLDRLKEYIDSKFSIDNEYEGIPHISISHKKNIETLYKVLYEWVESALSISNNPNVKILACIGFTDNANS
ncbi:MAG: DEAD/DEAH box helicase [Christensenellaceae bacterium]|jgi:hypothetical protein|nr:DEAD/DEAH box helicase [Christensenellaceae bacterium]